MARIQYKRLHNIDPSSITNPLSRGLLAKHTLHKPCFCVEGKYGSKMNFQYNLLFHFIKPSYALTNILTPWWTSMDLFSLDFPAAPPKSSKKDPFVENFIPRLSVKFQEVWRFFCFQFWIVLSKSNWKGIFTFQNPWHFLTMTFLRIHEYMIEQGKDVSMRINILGQHLHLFQV